MRTHRVWGCYEQNIGIYVTYPFQSTYISDNLYTSYNSLLILALLLRKQCSILEWSLPISVTYFCLIVIHFCSGKVRISNFIPNFFTLRYKEALLLFKTEIKLKMANILSISCPGYGYWSQHHSEKPMFLLLLLLSFFFSFFHPLYDPFQREDQRLFWSLI